MTKKYDVVVIGAGPGGLTAALYASRSNLSVLILDRGIYGGQMNNTADVENYPGFENVKGPELSEKMYASAIKFGAEYGYGNVSGITDHGDHKVIHTDDGDIETLSVVIATGAQHKHLGVPGEEEYSGMGVSYCAVCDGAFFRDKDVVVVGGGDSAVEEGIYLTQLAKSVTLIHRRSELKAQQILQERAFKNDKMNFIWDAQVETIDGDGQKVTSVTYKDKNTGEQKKVEASGVFIYVGIYPITEPFKDLGILNENGWIQTDELMKTKVPGIFAVGDVREKALRQITTAVGDGGNAGQQVYDYIQELKH
ncbi:thioredoxin-disulfide reductase [Holzapfeliella sp. JNUCC 80]